MTDIDHAEINRLQWIEERVRAFVFYLREDAEEVRDGIGCPASPEMADGMKHAADNLADILRAAPPGEPPLNLTKVRELRDSLRRGIASLDVVLTD